MGKTTDEKPQADRYKEHRRTGKPLPSAGVLLPQTDELYRRLHEGDVRRWCTAARADAALRETLCGYIGSAEPRVAANAAWILTRLRPSELASLRHRRDALADLLLSGTTPTLRRLLLKLLVLLPAPPEPRTDLLDYCLARIASGTETTAVRMFSLKLAYAACRPYPELTAELCTTLDMLNGENLSPGMRSIRRRVLQAIAAGRPLRP